MNPCTVQKKTLSQLINYKSDIAKNILLSVHQRILSTLASKILLHKASMITKIRDMPQYR